ncbi:MAG: hypothetical protein RLZZ618_3050 [Pseudomonadota bacterium]|jgi:hypothetical protein
MMHGLEKSDPAMVAVKPANKAAQAAAEWVEPRAGTKGNAEQPSHATDSAPSKRVTGDGPCTAGCEAETIHSLCKRCAVRHPR